MGVLSFRLKSNFLDFFKCINSFNWLIVFLSVINLSVCIYEDQIGKFDWRQSYVGRIKFAHFDTVSTAKRIIVATEENVLAALHLKTGEIVWRHVFESSSAGDIQLLHVSDKVHTVTGSNPYLVRGWDPATGVLLWEWSLTLNAENAEHSEWWVQQGLLVHMLPVFKSHIEVTTYNVMTGQNRGATSKLPAVWANEGCVVSPPYYSCISDSGLMISLDVTSNAMKMISKPVSDVLGTDVQDRDLRPLDGGNKVPGFIVDDRMLVLVKENSFEAMKLGSRAEESSFTIVNIEDKPVLLQAHSNDDEEFTLSAYSVPSGGAVPGVGVGVGAGRGVRAVPRALVSAAHCASTCRLLLTGADDCTVFMNGESVVWRREEALARATDAHFVSLPVSPADAAIETEFHQNGGGVLAAFARRLQSQWSQAWALAQQLAGDTTHHHDHQHQPQHDLVRDYFNLHKIIVIVTEVGKMFGVDSLSGAVVWSRWTGDVSPRLLLPRRDAAPPLVTMLAAHQVTGKGVVVSVEAHSGALAEEGLVTLDTRVLQASTLHVPDETHLHALLILDEDENVMVFPRSAARLVRDSYLLVAHSRSAEVTGYALKYDGQEVKATRTWKVQAGGGGGGGEGGSTVAALGARRAGERVLSAGRVLGDRSVLYKYINPNLVLLLVDGPKETVTALALDAVSGRVVTSQSHRRARACSFALVADNMLMYAVYNEKHRRTDIATLELYWGRSRASGAEFSSWAGGAPAAQRQSYVSPPPAAAAAAAAAFTATLRSVSDTHALLALTSGAIVEIPWALLDPRRGSGGGSGGSGGGGGEEALPYSPELALPAEATLNYNRSVLRPARLHTAPAGLESTSLVLATGLDIYFTRVAPSKTFDLLKEDFEYYVIAGVLGALVAAAAVAASLAQRKMLNNAWK